MSRTRLVSVDDAAVLAELHQANREFLTPWEPLRDDEYFTVDGQREAIAAGLERYEQGSAVPHVVLDDTGRVIGGINLNSVIRGAFQSASIGYWVSAADNGQGHASAAVRDMVRLAFEDLGLHRVQGETLLRNIASQRVLERNGFIRYGVAPTYLKIAGEWQDCALYQVVTHLPGSTGFERS